MNRVELKEKAKMQIKGKVGILFLITLIIGLITGLIGGLLFFIPYGIGSIISSLILAPAFTISMIRVYLNVIKGYTPKAKDAFSGFDDFFSAFKLELLVGLFTLLWSLLLIVPGIIKAISYSMAPYILAENKGKPALECIEESKKMTEGHKKELFKLALSFLGWLFLCALTCGIGYIWVLPYMETTFANAYTCLKSAPTTVNV